jgi:hypothetical protein
MLFVDGRNPIHSRREDLQQPLGAFITEMINLGRLYENKCSRIQGVDGNIAASMKTKAYIPSLFEKEIAEGGSIHCHFWGDTPLFSKKGSIYRRLKDANALIKAGFMSAATEK